MTVRVIVSTRIEHKENTSLNLIIFDIYLFHTKI
jgi:hypothetical protein